MRKFLSVLSPLFLAATLVGSASAQTQAPGQSAKRGGRRAGAPPPMRTSASFETERANWRMRMSVGHRDLFRWQLATPTGAFRDLTFTEAVIKSEPLGLSAVQGSNTQKVSPQIQKNLDYNLTPEELAVVTARLKESRLQMPAYQVDSIPADDVGRRKLFAFAKSLGAEMIVASPDPAALDGLDKLANEIGINLALQNRNRKETPAYADPKGALAVLQGRSKRIGVSADIGAWIEEGIKPAEALAQLKDRVMAVNLRDRSAFGSGGRDVTLGSGAAGMTNLFREMNRLGLKPMFLTVDATGAADTYAGLLASIVGFERTVQPVEGELVNEIARTRAIRGPNELSAEVKQKIDAAIPRQAFAKPKKPRRLLVIDACIANMSHNTIPHGNYALELMGKYTGAFQPVFDNNLDNLKWDKIRQYDAIFLNDTTGEIFADTAVREGILRFVRGGGGLGGIHGVTYTARNWPEYMDMIGAGTGPHWVHPATWKIDDPNSPLTKMFGDEPFTYTDEYYRFLANEQYSREKLHVLFSLDVNKTDMTQARAMYFRPDKDYAVAWIKSYGKGRIYICSLGHMPDLFMQPKIDQHFLAAIQFLLGDLQADTTPSARFAAQKR